MYHYAYSIEKTFIFSEANALKFIKNASSLIAEGHNQIPAISRLHRID